MTPHRPAAAQSTSALLADHAPVGLLLTDRDWRIVGCNTQLCALTGYDVDELLGESLGMLLTRAGRVLHQARFARDVLIDGGLDEVAIDLVRQDGSRTPVLMSSRRTEDDRLPEAICTTSLTPAETRRSYELDLLAARRRADAARRHLARLYEATRQLNGARSTADVRDLLSAHLAGLGHPDAVIHLGDGDGDPPSTRRPAPTAGRVLSLDGPDGPLGWVALGAPHPAAAGSAPAAAGHDDDHEVVLEALLTAVAQAQTRLELMARLQRQALTDPLTGLANRRRLDEALGAALESQVASGRAVTLCFIDLDGFKQINDRHGHLAGDQALVAVAAALRDVVGQDDLVARVGGDEFALLTEDLRSPAAAEAFRDRLTAAMQVQVGEQALRASVGIVHVPPGEGRDLTPGDLLRIADGEMYRRKAGHAARPAGGTRDVA